MINEQEIEKLWQAFKVLDVDGNGAISTEELGEVMRSLGQNPTEAGLRDLIKEIDVDLSGTIDFEEFKTLMISNRTRLITQTSGLKSLTGKELVNN